jgi:hydrophobe/amphiphile efflux-3 (HAE3) family protein
MRNLLARIAGRAVEQPLAVIVIAVLLTLIGAIAALRLEANTATDTLVDRGSSTYDATQRFHQQFGDDPVVVLVRGDLRQLLLTSNLGRLLALESCLSGRAPGGQVFSGKPAPAPCAGLAESRPSQVVYGPATFLNQFAIQADKLLQQQSQDAILQAQQAARQNALRVKKEGQSVAAQRLAAIAAGQRVLEQFQQSLLNLAVRYNQTGPPRLNDPRFVESVVFDSSLPGFVPKARFSYLFPSSDAALISVRLRPDLSDTQRQDAISLIRQAVNDPKFALSCQGQPAGSCGYLVSGVPVVAEGLAQELSTQIFILLAAALAVMAITLALVFRPPLRLLPLGIALGAAGIGFGFLSLAGGSLTMASIAVLPVLIGLAVDYAIQFQARFVEAAASGSSRPRAAVEAAAAGGPVIGTAGLATAAGFLVLLLSPIPMVRAFGLLLVAGIAIAFALALTAGLATLSLTGGSPSAGRASRAPARSRGGGPTVPAAAARPFRAIGGAIGGWTRGPRERLRLAGARLGRRAQSVGQRSLAFSITSPGRVLSIAAVLAIAGWVAGTQIGVISDIRQLVPRSLPELRDVDQLEQATGVSGEVDVTVTAPDLTDPNVILWMKDFESRVLTSHGLTGTVPSCRTEQAQICPAISLPDLFGDQQGVPSQQRIRDVLSLLPRYFSQAVISPGPKPGVPGNTAVIAFGIKVMPFDEQEQLINDIRSELNPPGTENDPPAGVQSQVVGLPVLAADANSELSSNRYLLTVAGLLAVALVLLAVYRSFERMFVPLVPIVLATGWSSLILWASGVPLNPLSATLGALVIAIATEFSVILAARYHEERARGGTLGEALRRAYSRTGAAVAASGTTAIAGFAVLAIAAPIESIFGGNPVRMLTDFGVVGVFDLTLALAGVFLVLPATLVWAEGGFEPVPALAARLRRRRARAATDAA